MSLEQDGVEPVLRRRAGRKEVPRHAVTICDPVTGEALYTYHHCPLGREDDCCTGGQFWHPGEVDARTHFVDPDTRQVAAVQPLSPTVTANRIEGIPTGTKAFIAGVEHPVTDGAIALETPVGPQEVRVELFHPRHEKFDGMVPCAPETSPPAGSGIAVEQDYARLRQAEYRRRGITVEALIVARAEADAGDPAEWNELIARRSEVKAAIPKPADKEN